MPPEIFAMSFDEFQLGTARWFLELQLRAARGRITTFARLIRRNRTDTYKLLRRIGIDAVGIRAEFGLHPRKQNPRLATPNQVMLQKWLASSATARRQASAIIAAHGGRS